MTIPTARPAVKQPPVHAPNAALLIDFDNVTMGIRSDLQVELRRLMNSEIIRGKVAVQRAYADWRRYPQYIVPLSEASIDLIFAPAFGSNKKNATDIRLAIDALELVFTRPEIGTFILLSGDSDFSSLVIKLKEYGKYVIGVGIRESSSDLLIQNCDEYYSYNELAGLTRVGDEAVVTRDPWELVVDALLEMKKRGDVMRSDRLKQVMQELDPSFDEKNVGMNRFSKFVDEARRRGLIIATKLDNGQYEVDLGAEAPGGARALPPIPGGADERRGIERAELGGKAEAGGRTRGGRKRGGKAAPAGEPKGPARDGAPAGSLSLSDAFALLKRALLELGAVAPQPVGEDDVRELMRRQLGRDDEAIFHRPRFGRLLRQAKDAALVSLDKDERGYRVALVAGTEATEAAPSVEPAPAEAPRRGGRSRGGRGRPQESESGQESRPSEPAPAEARTPAPGVKATPTRGLRWRRGSKGGPSAGQVPLIGVVDVPDETPAAAPARQRKGRAGSAGGGSRRGGRRKKSQPSE